MSNKGYLAVAVASAALIAGAAPAGARIILNGLIHNGLVHNALVHNALTPTGSAAAAAGPQLSELNGVAVEAVTLPAELRR